MKPCTSFDTLGMDSGENQEFGTSENDYMRFDRYLAPAVKSLKEDYPGEVCDWIESFTGGTHE